MPTKRPKHKSTGEKITAAEVAARREELTLRRARNQQIRIRLLARSLAQAIFRADMVRVETARALCEGTRWGVFGVEEIDRLQAHEKAADALVEHQRGRLAQLEAERLAATVE